MGSILLVVLVLLYTFQSVFCKGYNENYSGKEKDAFLTYTVTCALVTSLVAFALNGFSYKFDIITVALGIANAGAYALYNKCFMTAASRGPYSVLMVCNLSGAIVLPTVVNLFFSIKISVIQWIALALVLLAIYMVSRKQAEQEAQKGFYLACAGIFLANGAYGTFLSLQETLTEMAGSDVTGNEMIITTFLSLAVIMIAVGLANKKKAFITAFKQNKKSGIYLVLSATVVASAISLLAYLLTRINTTVLYTCDNAGVLLCSVAYSVIFYKEKLSLLNIVGCVAMVLGIIGITGII